MSDSERRPAGKARPPYAAPLPDPINPAGDDEELTGEPNGELQRRGRPVPPRHVVVATWLMYVNAAFALLSLIVRIATPMETYRGAVASAYPDLTPERVAQLAESARAYYSVIEAIFLVAWLTLTVPVRRGRRWARAVTFFLAGLGLVAVTAQADSGVGYALTAVAVAVDVAIIGLLASRSSRAFFPKRPRLRRSDLRQRPGTGSHET